MYRRLIPLLFVLCLPARAQNLNSWELQGEYGFLFLHSEEVRPIGQSYPFGLGLSYSRWMLKEKNWKNCHCYPRWGISLNYHNYDNAEILGWGLPLYGFLEPQYRLFGNFFFTLRGGAGYTWLSNPYDSETNPLNVSYSLPLTPFVMLGTGFSWHLNPHWRVGAQLRYSHASNGGLQQPNKGLNYPTVAMGVDYSVKAADFKPRTKAPVAREDMRESLSLSAFAAGKAIDSTRVTYAVPGLELKYSRQVGRVSALVGGVEWISNLAYREVIRQYNTGEDHNQLGLLLGHEFLMGNFTFTQLAGVYLYKDFDVKPDWYQRYGLTWHPFDHFYAGSQIKVHGHVAEFLDFRLGYRYTF